MAPILVIESVRRVGCLVFVARLVELLSLYVVVLIVSGGCMAQSLACLTVSVGSSVPCQGYH